MQVWSKTVHKNITTLNNSLH